MQEGGNFQHIAVKQEPMLIFLSIRNKATTDVQPVECLSLPHPPLLMVNKEDGETEPRWSLLTYRVTSPMCFWDGACSLVDVDSRVRRAWSKQVIWDPFMRGKMNQQYFI